MSVDPTMTAAQQAHMAAVKSFNIEAFTLMAVAILATSLRIYWRLSTVGFSNFQADDYLVLVGTAAHCIETGLAYSVGVHAHGLANDNMTPQERQGLSPDSAEYATRVIGSKIQICGWATYSVLLWSLKASICRFLLRLTDGLFEYRRRILFGFALIICTWIVVVVTLFSSCRPFYKYWQINPDPGVYCHPAVSPALIWVFLSMNVFTDLYLISIPMPLLFFSTFSWRRRIALAGVFCCGIFVIIAATLRVALIVTDPKNGALLAGVWAVRETFVAVITTNMPILFPLFRRWLAPFLCYRRQKAAAAAAAENKKSPTDESSLAGAVPATVGQRRIRRQPQHSLHHITALSTWSGPEDNGGDQNTSNDDAAHIPTGQGGDGGSPGNTRRGSAESSRGGGEPSGIQRRVDVLVEGEERGGTALPVIDGNFTLVEGGGAIRGQEHGQAGTGDARRIMTTSPIGARSRYFADHVKSENYPRTT